MAKTDITNWKTVKICSHTIEYNYENGQDISGSEEEHIQKLLCENYVEGELCDINVVGGELGDITNDEEEVRGWWRIAKS